MLFSSFDFIALFLPLAVCGYFLFGKLSHKAAIGFLVLCSFLFYGWWNPAYVPLLLFSILFNFYAGESLRRGASKRVLGGAIAVNLSLLAWFKYAGFFAETVNTAMGAALPILHVALPLGISFFTFQAIAYLVDCRRGLVRGGGLLEFALFKSFFPQLIAGPIVHHAQIMPQFSDTARSVPVWNNMACGLFVFAVGLFKKVCIADSLAPYADWGFDTAGDLSMAEAWLTVFAYSFQLYFDFSGYVDMAVGAALFFNTRLPQNFDSPYKARNIQDFWRRWHMTLGAFLREYVYIPLGGDRHGAWRRAAALTGTFLLGGLWHGAAWTFILWGAAHAAAMLVFIFWRRLGMPLWRGLSWFLTFLFVCSAWVMFRAKDWATVEKVYSGMFNIDFMGVYEDSIFHGVIWLPFMVGALFLGCLLLPNSAWLREKFKPTYLFLMATIIFAGVSFFRIGDYSPFLYFQF